MGSVMSLSCSKRKATSQDLDSSSHESRKRQKICSANDDEIPSLPVTTAVGFFTRFTRFIFQQDKKDVISSFLSLPSIPTSLYRNYKHHVFPSFHGADVRTTILSHIMESFRRKGIDTFIDNEIERSKSIGPELVEAIRGSKIAIVLLSKNYASSSWCLDELAEIMTCKEVLAQKVMPIFYEVDPTDIKKQTGNFGKAFKKTCKGKKKEHTERWRKALHDVATIAGEHSRNWRNEAAMIETISINVSEMLNNSTPSRDFDCLVGMGAHMEEMEQLLCLDLVDEVRMIGIWGPPGIGKTTIARFMLNQVSSKFQHGAIMDNIKQSYQKLCLDDEYSAQLQLQQQLLSKIIDQNNIMHLGMAKEWLKHKKVILVLDEVNHLRQLDALAKETQWFGPGSRIIITTENRRVLDAHGINLIYKVKFPSSDEAFQIFCMHAFGQEHPDDGFFELARYVTHLAGQLPLGLKVLGSALRRMSKQEWERTLPRLANQLDGEIESIIKFSFDALLNEDKDLFLYIACLFIEESRYKVEDILEKKFPYVRQGLHVLEERSLISFDYEVIKMHTLLEQFGRKTSRKQFVHHGLAKPQLLVGERDICELLSDDSTDGRRFIGINFDISWSEEELEISEKLLESMSDLQFVRIEGTYLDHPEKLHTLLHHSQKVISLDWRYFQNICLPSTFNPDFLVKLDMQYSKLQKLWEGTKPLRNLKWMDLSSSRDLKKLPDLSTATNLKELNLYHCSSLMELPYSIGRLTNLQILDLSCCSSLVELPSSIENATSLTDLDLSNCSKLVELPSVGNATKLERLNLYKCSSLVKLHPFIVTNLQTLDLRGCSSLVKLPPFIVTNPQTLDLRGCSSLVKLPSFIGDFTNLREIDLRDCSSLVELPVSIGTATNLKKLDLRSCSKLVKLHPFIVTNLQTLDLRGCSSLVKLLSFIGDFNNLREFDLRDCSSLVELPVSIGTVTNLKEMDLTGCSSLIKLPSSVVNLIHIERFDLSNCSSLVKLPFFIGDLTYLKKFILCDCSSLLELPVSIGTATKLKELDLSGCSSLVELPSSIGDLNNLNWFNLSNCSSLMELPSSIGDLINLNWFNLSNCSSLMELPSSIGDLINLNWFNLSNCSRLMELPSSIGDLINLYSFDLPNCSGLMELPSSIGDLINLISFNLSNCSSLMELPSSIGDLINLDSFDLSICSSLMELPSSIRNLQQLSDLRMCGLSKMEAFPTNINLESLDVLDLADCSQLKFFPDISTNIEDLNLIGTAIKAVPMSIMSWSRLSDFRMSYFESLKDFPHALDIITELHLNKDIQEVAPWVKGISRLHSLILSDCDNLVSLPQFSDSLSYINAENCKSLERFDCSFKNPEIDLNFINCFKLDQEARDLIIHTSIRGGCAMLPGSQVPACFEYRATGGSSLTIRLNERHLSTSLDFKACIMVVMDEEETGDDDRERIAVDIEIKDKQNNLMVPCTPDFYKIKGPLTEHIYTFKVEAEEMTSTELVFEFKTRSNKWKIGECGLLQIVEVPSS